MMNREDTVNSYMDYLTYIDGIDRRLWEIRNPESKQKKTKQTIKQTIMPDGIGEHNIKICYL